jgi:hypothetical protein
MVIKPSFEIAVKKLFLSWERKNKKLLVEAVGDMAQAVAADPSIRIRRPLDHAQFENLPVVKEIRSEIAAAEEEGLRKELFWRFEQEVKLHLEAKQNYIH